MIILKNYLFFCRKAISSKLVSTFSAIQRLSSFLKLLLQVLDNGGIQECDKPHVLLEDDESAFSEFVRMTGSREKELRSMAKAVGKI